MKKIGLFLPLLVLLLQCAPKDPPVVTDIPDEKITKIMADLHLADAATNGLAGYEKDSLMKVYFKQVFEMHGIEQERYEKNLEGLSVNILRMEAVVRAADSLLLQRDSLYMKKDTTKSILGR
ncbi:MAG: DUF4296 domain-containing protein [Saprospiraceae bacterium]|nr:DUF4296 domain-containing protein [Saprospiraceae bacterium]